MNFPTQNEALRLRALSDYEIVGTGDESDYDDLARLARLICGTPSALVSFIDETRQWCKSRIGFDAREMPREHAFCAQTILNPKEVLVIEDATADWRFCDNPLVTGAPRIRFYAGAPYFRPKASRSALSASSITSREACPPNRFPLSKCWRGKSSRSSNCAGRLAPAKKSPPAADRF